METAAGANRQTSRQSGQVILAEDGGNYLLWKTVLSLELRTEKFAHEVTTRALPRPGNPKDDDTEEIKKARENWEAGNRAALAILLRSVKPSFIMTTFYDLASSFQTADNIWANAASEFGSSSGDVTELVLSKFIRFSFDPSRPTTHNLDRYENIIRIAESTGTKISDDLKCARMIEALPDTWAAFKMAWAAQIGTKTFTALRNMIKAEGDRMENRERCESATALLSRMTLAQKRREKQNANFG